MSTTTAFSIQRDALDAQFYLINAGRRYTIQMNTLTVIFGVSLGLCLVSLTLRARDGNAWSHRIHQNSRGKYYVPNSVISWLIASKIFYAVAQGYLLSCRRYAMVGSDLTNAILWRALSFLPLWLGAWIQGWAAIVAPLLNREARRRPEFFQAPSFINSLAIPPILVTGTLLPLSILTNSHYNKAFYAYRSLRELLTVAILGGEVEVGVMEVLGGRIESEAGMAVLWLERVWIIWCISTAAMLFLYTTAATIHFLGLSSEMKLLSTSPSSNRRQLRSLKRSFSSLVFTTAAILIGGLSEFVMLLVLATNTEKVAKGGLFGELIMLLTLWVIAILIGAVSIVIFLRSLTFFTHPTTCSHPGSTSITTLPSSTMMISRDRGSSPPPFTMGPIPSRPLQRPETIVIGGREGEREMPFS